MARVNPYFPVFFEPKSSQPTKIETQVHARVDAERKEIEKRENNMVFFPNLSETQAANAEDLQTIRAVLSETKCDPGKVKKITRMKKRAIPNSPVVNTPPPIVVEFSEGTNKI